MMKENKETKLGVKKITAQKEKLDVQGQGCWDDCRIWKNYTTAPKCELEKTSYNNIFL